MRRILFALLLCSLFNRSYAQENRIKYNPKVDDTDIAVFMNMMGFDYHKFELQSETPCFLNIYINEYLNDKIIDSYDHISVNKADAPKSLYNMIFPKVNLEKFTLKIYTISKGDSIEQLRFRLGELGLYKKLKVNKKEFDYSWKLTEFSDNIGPTIEIEKKIPLLFYATAVEENIEGNKIQAFCQVPNILNNRHLMENQGKIKHYFEIGIELVKKIE